MTITTELFGAYVAGLGAVADGSQLTLYALRSGISQNIPLWSGTNEYCFNQTTAQYMQFTLGSAASPDETNNPLVKISRTIGTPGQNTQTDAGENLAAFVSVCYGVDPLVGQPVGVFGAAINTATYGPSGSGGRFNDACGVYGVGWVKGPPGRVGMGGFFLGRADVSGEGSNALQLANGNFTGVAGAYNPTGFTPHAGIWLTAYGNAESGCGLVFGNPFGAQYSVGIGFPAQVSGGLTGAVKDITIRDDTNATTSIQINGTRSYGIDMRGCTSANGAIILSDGFSIGLNRGIVGQWGVVEVGMLELNSFGIIAIGTNATALYLPANISIPDYTLTFGTADGTKTRSIRDNGTSLTTLEISSNHTNGIDMSGATFSGSDIIFSDGGAMKFQTTTGTKIGNTTSDKFGFWGTAPIAQPGAISPPSGGGTVDAQARTAIASILNVLSAAASGVGLTA